MAAASDGTHHSFTRVRLLRGRFEATVSSFESKLQAMGPDPLMEAFRMYGVGITDALTAGILDVRMDDTGEADEEDETAYAAAVAADLRLQQEVCSSIGLMYRIVYSNWVVQLRAVTFHSMRC
jgi:hypothetical protein